jgi:hypothetical protein
MKAAINFNPDQAKIITDTYELAKKRFVSTRPLTKVEEDKLAKAVIMFGEAGCLETKRLASRAIMAVKASVPAMRTSEII